MAIKKVWIEDGCIGCGLCVDICPEVFSMLDDKAIVIEKIDLIVYENLVLEAAENCPAGVIKFD